jgi:hypothetical protein
MVIRRLQKVSELKKEEAESDEGTIDVRSLLVRELVLLFDCLPCGVGPIVESIL